MSTAATTNIHDDLDPFDNSHSRPNHPTPSSSTSAKQTPKKVAPPPPSKRTKPPAAAIVPRTVMTGPTSAVVPPTPATKQTPTGSSSYRAPAPRGQTINRLSRVFEDNAAAATTTTSWVSPPPSPSMPSPTTTGFPATRPLRAPLSPSTAAFPARTSSLSADSLTRPNISRGPSYRKPVPKLDVKEEDEGVDETHVPFTDLKAKFQNKMDESIPTPASASSKQRPPLNLQLSSSIQSSDARHKQASSSTFHPPPSPTSASSYSNSTSPTASTFFSFRGGPGTGTGTNTANTSTLDSMSEPADDRSASSDLDDEDFTYGRGEGRERDGFSSTSSYNQQQQRPLIPTRIYQQQRVPPPIPKKVVPPSNKGMGWFSGGIVRPPPVIKSSVSSSTSSVSSVEAGPVEPKRKDTTADGSVWGDERYDAETAVKPSDFAAKKANIAEMFQSLTTSKSTNTSTVQKPLPPVPNVPTITTTTDSAPSSTPSTPSNETASSLTQTMTSRLKMPRMPTGRRNSNISTDADDLSVTPPTAGHFLTTKVTSSSPSTRASPSPASSLRLPIFSPFATNSTNGTVASSFTGTKRTRNHATISSIFGRNNSEDNESSSASQASADDAQNSDASSPAAEVDLPPPRPPSPPPDPVEVERKRREKRRNVVRELVETEIGYLRDMRLLQDVYYKQAAESSVFDKNDLRIIFSNLVQVVQFSIMFIDLLESASAGPDKVVGLSGMIEDVEVDDGDELYGEADGESKKIVKVAKDENLTWVGEAFTTVMRQLEETYCEYVKRQESSVLKLQEMEANKEVKNFLKICYEQVQGKTKSWDVFSLLVKPVQRVLKYPLLLDLILSLTPPAHPDYRELQGAAHEIQAVADRINEIKRRKDIVEKIVGDRKRTDVNVVHGINKTITRRAQKFKQVTGMGEITIDIFYDALCQRFTEQQETARQLERDIQLWMDDVRNYFEIAKIFAKTIEDLYDTWPGANPTSLQRAADFRKCVNGFADSCGRDLEKRVNNIYPTIVAFLNVFKNPAQVMRKREKKLLDYDRVRGIKARGDIPDKALQESADAYVSINTQLAEELPKFFNLTITYFDYIVQEFSGIQAKFYQQMVEDLQLHMYKEISALVASEMRTANVVEGYWEAVDRPGGLESEIRTIGLLNKRMVPRSGASSPNWSEIGGATLTRRRSQSGSLSLTGESDYVRKPVASPPPPAPSLSGVIRDGKTREGLLVTVTEDGPYTSGQRTTPFTVPRKSPRKQKSLDTVSNSSMSILELDTARTDDMAHSILMPTTLRSTSTSIRQFHDALTLISLADHESTSVSARSSFSTFSGDDGHSTTTAGATNYTASDDSLFRCVALYTYHTTSDDELAFKKDAVIDVWYCEGEDKDAWWYGKRVDEGDEVCGWFPASYCKKIKKIGK